MSLSKLESLPNEILTDIFEKYINGIDILKAFAFQLNHRFDALIIGCQRLRFDFIRCHKNDFRLCMGLLPAYIDKIEELALSEENTPGQIHGFLSFYPSFDLLKQLRKLYFHIDPSAVQPDFFTIALHSLLRTSLHTLSIKITKAQKISSLDNTIVEIFRIKTLKKLSFSCDSYRMQWIELNEISSNIKYLTIDGIFCEFTDLEYIFRCVSGLQYLNIQLESDSPEYESKSSSKDSIPRMSMLHTVLFKIENQYPTMFSDLDSYLRCMPSLCHLEITGHCDFNYIKAWEILLERLVPRLTHFYLESCIEDLESTRHHNLFESIQTPFWLEKKNFNIIIKQYTNNDNRWNFVVNNVWNINSYIAKNPVDLWYLRPRRKLNDNLSATNKISSLKVSATSKSLLQNHYFNNVKHLVVKELNDDLLELITTHVNCSQIRHLDVTDLSREIDGIGSFLPYIRNIASLRINFYQLFDNRFVYLKECNNLKFLDISAHEHRLDEKHISTIASICPNIEHLIINTQDLQNIPMLQIYLSHLRSLSFVNNYKVNRYLYRNYAEVRGDEKIRRDSQFLFHRESNRITVWIDETALEDSFWENINSDSEEEDDDSWS